MNQIIKITKKQTAAVSALLLALLVLALVVLFHNFFQALLVLVLLFALGALSTSYKRKLEDVAAVGFELVTFTTTLAGIAFGPVIGALFGFTTSLTSVLISRDVGPTTLFFFLSSATVGALAQTLSARFSILTVGIISVLLATAIVQFFTFFVQKDVELKTTAALGMLTNFIVNYLFFAYLAEPILALIR